MEELSLVLFSRKGCCLCEGLEQRLRELSLQELTPSIQLRVIDIDDFDTSESVRARYDLEVPVMAIHSYELKRMIELPRASPRLHGDHLLRWLQQSISKIV